MIMSENVAAEGVVDKFIGEHHHDDRIDVESSTDRRFWYFVGCETICKYHIVKYIGEMFI